MPRAPKKCARCDTRVIGVTFCDEHKPAWKTSTRAGSTRASRKERADLLERNPICVCTGCRRCTPTGCRRPSTEDDHITNVASGGTEHSGNHQALCSQCHGLKTQREARAARA